MTFAVIAPIPDQADCTAILPIAADTWDEANLHGYEVATEGLLTGLCMPAGNNLRRYVVIYNHNGPRLTSILAESIEQAESILGSCLSDGIVALLQDS